MSKEKLYLIEPVDPRIGMIAHWTNSIGDQVNVWTADTEKYPNLSPFRVNWSVGGAYGDENFTDREEALTFAIAKAAEFNLPPGDNVVTIRSLVWEWESDTVVTTRVGDASVEVAIKQLIGTAQRHKQNITSATHCRLVVTAQKDGKTGRISLTTFLRDNREDYLAPVKRMHLPFLAVERIGEQSTKNLVDQATSMEQEALFERWGLAMGGGRTRLSVEEVAPGKILIIEHGTGWREMNPAAVPDGMTGEDVARMLEATYKQLPLPKPASSRVVRPSASTSPNPRHVGSPEHLELQEAVRRSSRMSDFEEWGILAGARIACAQDPKFYVYVTTPAPWSENKWEVLAPQHVVGEKSLYDTADEALAAAIEFADSYT